MPISYKRLWKLLIDKDLKKKDLQRLTGISSATMAKLSHNETIRSDTLERICMALDCNIADIMEFKKVREESHDE